MAASAAQGRMRGAEKKDRVIRVLWQMSWWRNMLLADTCRQRLLTLLTSAVCEESAPVLKDLKLKF